MLSYKIQTVLLYFDLRCQKTVLLMEPVMVLQEQGSNAERAHRRSVRLVPSWPVDLSTWMPG